MCYTSCVCSSIVLVWMADESSTYVRSGNETLVELFSGDDETETETGAQEVS